MLSLGARLDGAGDGWLELRWSASEPLLGVRLNPVACDVHHVIDDASGCQPVAVFGGAGGEAERAGWLFSAGHAMAHGVFGFCVHGPCKLPPVEHAEPRLLTWLSVALPTIDNTTVICTSIGDTLYVAQARAGVVADSTASSVEPSVGVHSIPLPRICSDTLSFGAPSSSAPDLGPRRGVAFVKTYKTGSSTIASLLQRRADIRSIDVAVNAKAVPHPLKSLEPRLLFRERWARPTDCLYEIHEWKECGAKWVHDQVVGGVQSPKPFGLVVDHSRVSQMTELREGRPIELSSLPLTCSTFVQRMRNARGAASRLLASTEARTDFISCVDGIASSSTSGLPQGGGSMTDRAQQLRVAFSNVTGLRAYRDSVPGGILLTAVRWPPARFTSAVEQFGLPLRTGVPCSKIRSRTGGVCHGHTCERDFSFSWTCLNNSVPRSGMLAAFTRCLFARPPTLVESTRAKLADLDAIAAGGSPPNAAVASAMANARDLLHARLNHRQTVKLSSSDSGADGPIGCGGKWRGQLPDFRYVQESVPNTLGWPIGPTGHGGTSRSLGGEKSGPPQEPVPLADGYSEMLIGDGRAAALAFRWLATVTTGFELAIVTEHFDESLLLLGKEMGWPMQDLLYLSQKRRKIDRSASLHPYDRAPAARAVADGRSLSKIYDWPDAQLFHAIDEPWLWPHELDAVLRGNWIDSLLYIHLNHSLWQRIEAAWPGPSGRHSFAKELSAFRAFRAAVQTSCMRCERVGPSSCLAAASRAPRHAPPHFCWQLRQDTSSWSEHFFSRMAVRFDAVAAAREAASNGPGIGAASTAMEKKQFLGHKRRRREEDQSNSGVITGNVNWWRCRDGRKLREGCVHKFHPRGGSAWDCLCSW